MVGGDEDTPISISKCQVEDLRKLLLRSLNKNQIVILSYVGIRSGLITSILRELSEKYDIPMSTLKLNAKILKDFNLLNYGTASNLRNAQLSDLGLFVLDVVGENQVLEQIDDEGTLRLTLRNLNVGLKPSEDAGEYPKEIFSVLKKR